MVSAAVAKAPTRLWSQRPALPAGVRLEGAALVDDVLGESFPLEGAAARLVGRFGALDLEELEALEPGSWPFLSELNSYHLLNLEAPLVQRPWQQWHGITRRTSLPGRGPRAFLGDAFGVGQTLAVVLANPRLMGLLAFTVALCVVCGAPALGVLLTVVVTLGGYGLHEFGHAAAARILHLPAYALADRYGVSIWARTCKAFEARLFACAGPLLPVALGLALWVAPFSWSEEVRFLCAFPLLIHCIALTPLCHDGRVLLLGRARDASISPERDSVASNTPTGSVPTGPSALPEFDPLPFPPEKAPR